MAKINMPQLLGNAIRFAKQISGFGLVKKMIKLCEKNNKKIGYFPVFFFKIQIVKRRQNRSRFFFNLNFKFYVLSRPTHSAT